MWCGHVLLNSMLLSVLTLLVQMSLLTLDDGPPCRTRSFMRIGYSIPVLRWRSEEESNRLAKLISSNSLPR